MTIHPEPTPGTREEYEAWLRALRPRYHINLAFPVRMNRGQLNRGQVQRWVASRCY